MSFPPETRVALALPTYDGKVHVKAAKAYWAYPSRLLQSHQVIRLDAASSLLPDTFNGLWVMALRMRRTHGATHFAMIHADVGAEPWWLDALLGELLAHRADLVSAAIPIKDERGLTSTGLVDADSDCWAPVRRLTVREVEKLPVTFGPADCGEPDKHLVVNTGLWVCDLRKPWCDTHAFELRTRIVWGEDGMPFAQSVPEDWLLSRHVQRCGGVVLATRGARVKHYGELGWPSSPAWGCWETDENYLRNHAGGGGVPGGGAGLADGGGGAGVAPPGGGPGRAGDRGLPGAIDNLPGAGRPAGADRGLVPGRP